MKSRTRIPAGSAAAASAGTAMSNRVATIDAVCFMDAPGRPNGVGSGAFCYSPNDTPTRNCQPERLSVKGGPSTPIDGTVPRQAPDAVWTVTA